MKILLYMLWWNWVIGVLSPTKIPDTRRREFALAAWEFGLWSRKNVSWKLLPLQIYFVHLVILCSGEYGSGLNPPICCSFQLIAVVTPQVLLFCVTLTVQLFLFAHEELWILNIGMVLPPNSRAVKCQVFKYWLFCGPRPNAVFTMSDGPLTLSMKILVYRCCCLYSWWELFFTVH